MTARAEGEEQVEPRSDDLPPNEARPQVCLSPPPPPKSNTDAIDLVVGVSPALITPLFASGRPSGFGATTTIGVRRELSASFDVSLLATAAPSTASGHLFAPVGGVLRIGTTALTPYEWRDGRLVTAIDLGAGTWLSRSTSGAGDAVWETTRGPWVSVGGTLLGLRSVMRRDHPTPLVGFEVGLPVTFLVSTQRSATNARVAPSYFTIGLGMTLYWHLRGESVSVDATP